jgi:hypothetical protein
MPPDVVPPEEPGDKQVFIDTLRSLGGKAGNVTLRRYLTRVGWDINSYWPVREYFLRKGEIALFRCRGGGVTIVAPKKDVPKAAPEAPAPAFRPQKEADYYLPLAETLKTKWCPDLEFKDFIVEVTGERNPGQNTGGAWTQPDIVVVHVGTYRHVPGKHLDLITFEVKPVGAADVKAPHQAMAHLKAATQAFVIIVGTPKLTDEEEERVHAEAIPGNFPKNRRAFLPIPQKLTALFKNSYLLSPRGK